MTMPSARLPFLTAAAILVTGIGPALGAQRTPDAGPTGLSSVGYFQTMLRANAARTAARYVEAESLYVVITTAYPHDSNVWESFASVEEQLGKNVEAMRVWESAWNAGAWPRGEVAYTIARLHARLGHAPSAMAWIDSALAHRLEDRPRLQKDSAFLTLRADPRFRRQAGLLPPGIDRVGGWRADIAYFVEEAQRLHVSLDRPAYSPAFLSAAAALSRDVPALSDAKVSLGLTRLATMLGDGHSYLVGPNASAPIKLYQFADGIYVVDAGTAAADLIGARVRRIGSVSADSAMQLIAVTASKDNALTPLWLGIGRLSSPRILYELGLSTDSTRLLLSVTDRTGVLRSVSLAPEPVSLRRKLGPSKIASSPAPLWLSRVDDKHWVTTLPAMNAVYAQYNQVSNSPGESVAQFADQVAAALDSSKASNLIVDVRHNNGGNRTLNPPLLLAMAAFKGAKPSHRVYVVMGRGTFSAAQVFLAQAEWLVDPIYVGEPSSSRPNFVGEETGTILPYSGMRGSASSQYQQGTTFQDERPFIAPHIPVALTSVDYFANRDPVMRALEALVRDSIQIHSRLGAAPFGATAVGALAAGTRRVYGHRRETRREAHL